MKSFQTSSSPELNDFSKSPRSLPEGVAGISSSETWAIKGMAYMQNNRMAAVNTDERILNSPFILSSD
jgi:hypothetical protein